MSALPPKADITERRRHVSATNGHMHRSKAYSMTSLLATPTMLAFADEVIE
jgi:hypothetical protein